MYKRQTIVGVAGGIATTIAPNFPFFLQLSVMGGYNTITPPKSISLGRHLGELTAYTTYAFAVKYASNEIIQYVGSLIDKF